MKFGNKIKNYIKKKLNENQINQVNNIYNKVFRVIGIMMYPFARYVKTPMNLIKNKGKRGRILEIGPGPKRVPGFETINVVWGRDVDYIGDASKKLPFANETFDLIYASHILEHIPWYLLQDVINEWVRTVKSGCCIEIWVPNGLLIAQTFVNAELGVKDEIDMDGWYKFNEKRDPCVWANGRIFSYGDGTGQKNNPNWHMAVFSPRYLEQLFMMAGLNNIEILNRTEVRGYDHGWINLGMRGYKL